MDYGTRGLSLYKHALSFLDCYAHTLIHILGTGQMFLSNVTYSIVTIYNLSNWDNNLVMMNNWTNDFSINSPAPWPLGFCCPAHMDTNADDWTSMK